MSAMLWHCMEGWLLGWRLWLGAKVAPLQEQRSLLPLSQEIFCAAFLPTLDFSAAATWVWPRVGWAGGRFAGGKGQPEKCLWGGSGAPQRHLLLLHILDVTPRPERHHWFVHGAGWAKRF